MSPSTCSRASLRLLTSVLLAASIANAVALPHQVLEARAPDVLSNEVPATLNFAGALEAVASPSPESDNTFEEVEQAFRDRTGLQVLKHFFARLFGWDDESTGDADATVTVTVSATPTPSSITSSTASEPVVAPPGRTPISTLSSSSETTASPYSTPEMSILPVGSMTTAINVTLPDPAFSTLLPPYPLNSTMVVVGPTATAVPITEWFSTNPIPTGAPYSTETYNGTSTITESVTSIILVTATLAPSVGTGLPVSSGAAPMWTNSSSIPTPIMSTGGALEGTGYGSLPAVTASPMLPNTTIVVPIIVNATGSPGTILNVTLPVTVLLTGTGSPIGTGLSDATATEIPPYANTTMVAPTGIVGTGTAAPMDTSLPLYPNVTTSTSTTTTTVAATELLSILPALNETYPTNDTLLEFPGETY
jgi:hypothetical protein